MAFNAKGWAKTSFSVVGSTVHTRHVYDTNDTADVVEGSDYFNPIADFSAVGDCIEAHVDLDGTPDVILYIITAISAGAVTVTPKLKSALYEPAA